MADEVFMRRAIELARQNVERGGGGPIGAVVVKDGRIVGEGANQVVPRNDPTAHAEIVAIRDACARLGTFRLDGCTVYTSVEPCPMCLTAILWARMEAIVYAGDQDDIAAAGFSDADFYAEVAKPSGRRSIPERRLMADEARAVLRQWADAPARIPY